MKILIAVDGSELSLDAVRHALDLAREGLRAEFVLVNVQEPASLYEMVVARDPQVLLGVRTGAGAHLLEAAEALFQAAGVPYECEVASGDPSHALIDVAERHGCDAVIMGARGHGGLTGDRLGTVAQAVAHNCAVPVTVVKHAQPDETLAQAGQEAEAAE